MASWTLVALHLPAFGRSETLEKGEGRTTVERIGWSSNERHELLHFSMRRSSDQGGCSRLNGQEMNSHGAFKGQRTHCCRWDNDARPGRGPRGSGRDLVELKKERLSCLDVGMNGRAGDRTGVLRGAQNSYAVGEGC